MRLPVPSTAPPTLTPFPVTPPGLPTTTSSIPVSQPLFPVVHPNSIPAQSSPFSAPKLSTSSSAEVQSSIDPNLANSTPAINGYQAAGSQGLLSFYYLLYQNCGF